MPKTSHNEETTQINFRMPISLLSEVEALALKKHHTRTTEIMNACTHWTQIKGDVTQLTPSSDVEERLNEFSKEINEIRKDIDRLISVMETERKQLLKIIEEGMKRL